MRVIVIKQATDLASLRTMLFKGANATRPAAAAPSSTADASMKRLQELNPHVDFQRIAAKTVLLLPDDPATAGSDSRSIADDAFDDFSAHIAAGFKTAAERARASAEAGAAERAAVTEALRDPVVARLIEADPLLREQLARAAEASAAEQKAAQAAIKQVDAMRKTAAEELRALRELLG
jgi:hypothetical protein